MADPRDDDRLYHPTRRRLLRDLTGAGVGAAGLGLLGCEPGADATTERGGAATPSCTLFPEGTDGPFYLDLDNIRRDVTEGKAGLRLDLRVKVVNASTCKPMEDVAVEIWHADAAGTYSGFSEEGTAGERYLRGVQLSGRQGVAQFRTIYPGWYESRAIHIHLKAHVGGRAAGRVYTGARTAHTGQLFYNDSVSDRVVRLSPYNARSGTRLRNSEDHIYGEVGSGTLLRLRRRKATTIRKGLIGSITVGIDPS
jgi:protocatechuate 3,4-dioxygenase beta subunit